MRGRYGEVRTKRVRFEYPKKVCSFSQEVMNTMSSGEEIKAKNQDC